MSLKSNLIKAAGLGVAITALTVGAASAAAAVSTANVRSGPGTGFRIVDTLFPGEAVAITGQSNGWCRVAKPGPDGYVACYLLSDDYIPGPRFMPGPRWDRYHRHDRWDRYDRGPSFGFSVGPGGFGFDVNPRPHRW